MNSDEVEAVLAGTREYHGNQKYSPEITLARRQERVRRGTMASNRAHAALAQVHRDEYLALRARSLDYVNAERGPLPGDES